MSAWVHARLQWNGDGLSKPIAWVIFMPTVLRLHGFRFMIFQGDGEHGPAHVHAIRAGTEVVLDLAPIAVRSIKGMGRTDVRRAFRIAEDHPPLLLNAWREANG